MVVVHDPGSPPAELEQVPARVAAQGRNDWRLDVTAAEMIDDPEPIAGGLRFGRYSSHVGRDASQRRRVRAHKKHVELSALFRHRLRREASVQRSRP